MAEPAVRAMAPADWPVVAAIYAEGIATGQATFETEVPGRARWEAAHPPATRLVAEAAEGAAAERAVVGWAALAPVSTRPAYAGVAEVSVYVAGDRRGRGVGRALLEALVAAAEAAGIWTLQASVFPENEASVALHRACGFRVVGHRERIGRLAGRWRDTLLLERRSPVVF